MNHARVKEFTRLGLMQPAGLRAHAARKAAKSGVYAYEQRKSAAPAGTPAERKFRRDRKAWAFFQAQPQWYRKTAVWWIVSAKKEETQDRRLATLIEDSAAGRPIKHLDRRRVRDSS